MCSSDKPELSAEAGPKTHPSDTVLEIGRKIFPRRYRRFKDLRPYQEACEWARTLDWRNNPYDRFLLRREILRHLESEAFYDAHWNIYTFASRAEIAAEVDQLLNNFPDRHESMGAFSYALVTLPWNLAFRHGIVRQDRLLSAMAETGETNAR